jgi:hypothetical protein
MSAYICVCHRSFFGCDVMSLLAFSPTVRWCGGPVVRRPGGLMMFSYVRLCSLMFSYVRLYPLMRGNARSLRLPGRFGTVCRGESGPTLGLTCAAGRHVKWYGWRHATRMKNAPCLRPRQRRQVQAMLGGGLTGVRRFCS